jgi:hypothetical protein
MKYSLYFKGGRTISYNGQKYLTIFTQHYDPLNKAFIQVYTYDLERKNLVGGGKDLKEYLLNCE